jgi:hypothetical protein
MRTSKQGMASFPWIHFLKCSQQSVLVDRVQIERLTRDKEYSLRETAAFAAEEERRSLMTPQEKVAENGLQLQCRLDGEPALAILLQPTPPGHMAKARCYANCCPFAEKAGKFPIEIRDDFRIVLTSTLREYFHVGCLEQMLDLPLLAASRFKLDMASYRWNQNWPWTWGLMLRKWFEHNGRIDLDKIAEYITAYKMSKEELGDFSARHIDWQPDT